MGELITNRIFELRAQAGITQETLAQKVQVTRQTIIAMEKGNYTPSVLLALKLAAVFKKPVEEIFRIKYAK
ncbi:MAG: helix-turn-helix transcriptional regulator [bacterium]|nr:helix-turn-helix transcriptional regulator [bacterium]